MTSSVPLPPPCSLLLRKLCDTTVLEQSVPCVSNFGTPPTAFLCCAWEPARAVWRFLILPLSWEANYSQMAPQVPAIFIFRGVCWCSRESGCAVLLLLKASCICSSNFCPNSCVLWAWLYGPIRSLYTPYLIWIQVFIFIFSSLFEQMEGALGILCSFARTLVWQMMIHCRDVKAWKRMVFLDNLKNCPWLLIKTAKKWLASIALQIKGLIDSTVLH